MKIADFGQYAGPVAVFGGVHSNIDALRAFLARTDGMPKLCTGDIVAYCASPVECVEAIQKEAIQTIAGNCEQQLGAGADDCGCGFESGSSCDLLSVGWYRHANRSVSSAQKAWMRNLPDIGQVTIAGKVWGVVHGAPSSVNKFIWPNAIDAELEAELRIAQDILGPLHGVICGHSGMAFKRETVEGVWLNAGAIGMPAHDGGARTRYCVIDESGPQFMDLHYDHSKAAQRMRDVGLNQGYDTALETGYWPSEDILPAALRR